MKETEKIHEFKTATRHLRERTRFPLLLKQPENMQGCGQRHLNVRKKQKKKTLSFLEENKIKGKSANMIQFKSRDKARIKHDKARLRWSHAPFMRLDRPQRDRLRLLAFFLTVTPRSSILEKVPLKETLRSQPFCHGRVSVKGMVLSYRLWG